MNIKKILLVEGKSDEEFFSAFYESLNLHTKVQVAPPKSVGGKFNNKEGVLNHLPVLLKQLDDGQLERLGVVVDADHGNDGGLGYQRTVDRVSGIVKEYGFSQFKSIGNRGGLAFSNSDGLRDFGLWVMPDNRSDGMFEDWIKACIVQSDAELMRLADKTVISLKAPKFKQLHQSKAAVATWLAWQRNPGRGVKSTVEEQLLNERAAPFVSLREWSTHVFVD